VAKSTIIDQSGLMVILDLKQVRQNLPALAERALGGEDVFIAVGTQKLRLGLADPGNPGARSSPRPGRGASRGTLTIPDGFHEPWTEGEMGE
jgi:hypothetical protein